MLVHLRDVRLSFFDKQIFDGITLSVHPGDRLALVGLNGAGKTSLFRIILGQLQPDEGAVVRTAESIGYLDQSLVAADEGSSCFDVVLTAFGPLLRLEREIERINDALAGTRDLEETEKLLERLGQALDAYEAGGGYEFRARAEATLAGLGLSSEHWSKPLSLLSSGQKARVALARLLLGNHDLLLLDEPTNHLDLDAREWLADALVRLETAYIVASHDRRFLDRVADKVAHLDRGRLRLYSGNYSAFRRQVEEAEAAGWRAHEKSQKLIRKLEEQARSYRNWAGAKESEKRGAGDKGFVGARAAKLAKRALAAQRRMEEAIERLKTEKPFELDPIKIDFHGGRTGMLVRARQVAVGYSPGMPLAQGIDFELSAGERLGIVGPNGSGKSTLIKSLLGEVPVLEGELSIHSNASVGYFDQEIRRLPEEASALAAVLETGKDETLVRTVLGRLRLRKESTLKPVADLSWGERAKTLLARLILGDHDLLILDEPTNYLDIETQDALLQALAAFPGGIIFVSHDRHFLETLATKTVELGRGATGAGPPV